MTESRFVDAGPVRLHVVTHGDADAPRGDLLILPGITSPARTWDFVAAPLAERGRRVHVLDHRGRGRSGVAASGRYTLDDYAGDAQRVIEALELSRPTVLGHSLGARVAAALGLRQGASVGNLVLAEPPLTGPGRAPYPVPLRFYLDGIEQAREGLSLDQARTMEPAWDDDRLRDRMRWLGTCDPRAVAETYRGFHQEDFLGLWDRLRRPGLIHGGASPVLADDGVRELRTRNPGAVVVCVEGADHMLPWSNLAGFVTAVDDLVAQLGQGAAADAT